MPLRAVAESASVAPPLKITRRQALVCTFALAVQLLELTNWINVFLLTSLSLPAETTEATVPKHRRCFFTRQHHYAKNRSKWCPPLLRLHSQLSSSSQLLRRLLTLPAEIVLKVKSCCLTASKMVQCLFLPTQMQQTSGENERQIRMPAESRMFTDCHLRLLHYHYDLVRFESAKITGNNWLKENISSSCCQTMTDKTGNQLVINSAEG